jgi:hypothetical protein
MTTENEKTKQPLNPDDLSQFIANARSSFQSYRQSAASAAGNVYLLWRDTQAHGAPREGRDWIAEVIEKRNDEIKKNNESVKSDKKYVDDYKNGKLSKDELVNQVGKNKEEKDLIAAEKKRLDDLVKKDDKYWDGLKLVPIEKRDGASKFTEVVKYVFEFDKPSHASMVNRFCLALEWIDQRFKGQIVSNVDEIISEFEQAGGFEVAVEDQRLIKNNDNTLSEDREIIAKRNYDDTRAALKGASPLGSVGLEARHEQDGLVLMIARYEGGNAHIVVELPAGEGEFKRLISRYENPNLLPVSDTTEFISRVMELGSLVSEGEGSSEDGVKTERLVLTNMKDGKPELMVSASNADSAAIVKVQPKEMIDLGITEDQLYLKTSWRKELEKNISSYEKRRLIDFTYDLQPKDKTGKKDVDASMAWASCNGALKDAGRSSATQQYYWYPITKLESRPLEPKYFEPSVRFVLKSDDLRTIYRGPLKAWEESKDSAKTSKMVTLKNEGESLHVTIKEGGSVTVGTEKAEGPVTVVRFRPRDLANLFSMLSHQHGSDYHFEIDDAGLLMVAWEDKFASYQVYLPTATKDGRLESRKVAPMRISLPMAAE